MTNPETNFLLNLIEGLERRIMALEGMQRGEGSGALTGFAAAKRAAEPGGAEDLPQSLAVSPVEALAAKLRELLRNYGLEAARHQWDAAKYAQARRWVWRTESRVTAAVLNQVVRDIMALLPEPESESSENAGDGKPSQESPEADATPSNGTASGRRNA